MQPLALTLQIDAKDYADWITGNLDRGRQISLLSGNTAEQVKKEVDALRMKAAATTGQQAEGSRSWFGSSGAWVSANSRACGITAARRRVCLRSWAWWPLHFSLFLAAGKLGLFRFILWLARVRCDGRLRRGGRKGEERNLRGKRCFVKQPFLRAPIP